MAYKHIPFYNLDQAVGPRAPNQRADVLLVQFFLRELFRQPDLLPDKPPGDLAVDGVFGPVTAQWISQYQKQLVRKGFGVQADNRVDPAQGELAFSKGSISHKRYTIWHMNQSYRKRLQKSHDHLESAPACLLNSPYRWGKPRRAIVVSRRRIEREDGEAHRGRMCPRERDRAPPPRRGGRPPGAGLASTDCPWSEGRRSTRACRFGSRTAHPRRSTILLT